MSQIHQTFVKTFQKVIRNFDNPLAYLRPWDQEKKCRSLFSDPICQTLSSRNVDAGSLVAKQCSKSTSKQSQFGLVQETSVCYFWYPLAGGKEISEPFKLLVSASRI